MCVIVSETPRPPTDTKLFSMPVLLPHGEKRTLLMYKNSLAGNGVMIVCVPTEQEVGLVNVNTRDITFLLDRIQASAANSVVYDTPAKEGTFGYFNNSSRGNTVSNGLARVHNVGNYKISVVYSFEELDQKIDWSVFRKPVDYVERVNTLMDENLFPFTNRAFIIAQAITSIKNDGFGVVYASPSNIKHYFPTCHEQIVGRDHGYGYDVKIYELKDKNTDRHSFFGIGGTVQYRNEDRDVFFWPDHYAKSFISPLSDADGVSRLLQNVPVQFSGGNTSTLSMSKVSFLEHMPLTTTSTNQNIIEFTTPRSGILGAIASLIW